MTIKPSLAQAAKAAEIIDALLPRMDCKGLTLLDAQALIAAVQSIIAYTRPDVADVPPAPGTEP